MYARQSRYDSSTRAFFFLYDIAAGSSYALHEPDLPGEVGEAFEVLTRALQVRLHADADVPVGLDRMPLERVERHVGGLVVLHVDPDERAGSVGTRRRGGVGRVNDAREVLLKHIVADVETDLARLHGDAGVDPRSAIDSTRSTYASASASAGAVPRSARRGGSECRPRPGR